MTYKCIYNANLNAVETVTYGAARRAELIDMLRCTVELCAQIRSADIIIDHSELDARALTMDEVKTLSSSTITFKDIFQDRKCVHVAKRDLQFGLVRACEIMAEVNGLADLNRIVFKNRDEAIKWIKT